MPDSFGSTFVYCIVGFATFLFVSVRCFELKDYLQSLKDKIPDIKDHLSDIKGYFPGKKRFVNCFFNKCNVVCF